MKTFITGLVIVAAASVLLTAQAYGQPALRSHFGKTVPLPSKAFKPYFVAPAGKNLADTKVVDYPIYDLKFLGDLGARMVKFGQDAEKAKTTFGTGECTDFISAALAHVGAKPGNFSDYRNYAWGTRIDNLAAVRPGDIIQFEECYFFWGSKASSWGDFEMKHHTSLIESANGTSLVLLHQNARTGGSSVIRENLDLNWMKKGRYTIWRAVKP